MYIYVYKSKTSIKIHNKIETQNCTIISGGMNNEDNINNTPKIKWRLYEIEGRNQSSFFFLSCNGDIAYINTKKIKGTIVNTLKKKKILNAR